MGVLYLSLKNGPIRPVFLYIRSMKEEALGLPSRSRIDPIDQKGQTRLVIQKHTTARNPNSPHYDLRLKGKGTVHSWAIKYLPWDKKRTLAVRQPQHSIPYLNFEGEIPEGYGKGSVKKVHDEKVKVTSATDDKIKMQTAQGNFAMIKTKGDKNWLIVKTAFVTSKPKYKSGEVDFNNPDTVLQPKVDGAHTVFELNSNDVNEIYSYRTSKKTGGPIHHADQVPALRDAKVPKSLTGTVIRGDLYGKTEEGPLPAEQIGGILNSSVPKSLEKQKETAPLQPYIFDIVKYKGKDVSNKPYADKMRMLKEVEKKIPIFRVAETAVTPEEKKDLYEKVKNKTHPDTVEGVVEWNLGKPGGAPKKEKFRDSHDVYIRGIYPAITRAGETKSEAGGFQYSMTPKGKIVGNVGTGFTQEKRKDMLQNPEKYIGMVARVKSPQQYSSGALRAPAFYSMDIEKNLTKQ